MNDLRAFGLHIRSAIPIPGAAPIACGEPDLEIVLGERRDLPPALYPYTLNGSGFSFSVAGIARYTFDGACRVVVEPAPAAGQEDVGAMLIATMLPALFWARGEMVLHAAAAILPGMTRAVAIAGPSGAGKSTLLARMIARGATPIADDSTRVDTDGLIAGLPGGRFQRRPGGTRRYVTFDTAPEGGMTPLGAMMILSSDGATPERLTGVEAVQALLAQRHRPTIARMKGIEAATLPILARLAATVPIVRWPARRSLRDAEILLDRL